MQDRVKMKVRDGDVRKEDFLPFLLGYEKEEAILEASRCLHCKIPRCKEACPIHNDIPDFIKYIKDDDLERAYHTIRLRSSLSEICGTVCPHEDQCEGACVLGIKGESVAIGALERYVSKWARENGFDKEEKKETNGKKVACIGSGPASLACALKLVKEGYSVDIYEKDGFVGGVLTWGIPSYRLEREAIGRKIEILKELGVSLILNQKVKDLTGLREDYDAIFLGIGAPDPNRMHIKGEDLKGIYQADTFLKAINMAPLENGRRHFEACGERVIVVGGGNVAMDAARDAIRLPQVKEVTIVYRRKEDEMPACKEELEHAKEEGVIFKTLVNPIEFQGEGCLREVILAINELGEPDQSGRRRPVDTGKRMTIEADTVVLALGFSNDKTLGDSTDDLDIDKWGCFIVDDMGRTSAKAVYAGGDATSGASTVVKAMDAGQKAARAIIEDLS